MSPPEGKAPLKSTKPSDLDDMVGPETCTNLPTSKYAGTSTGEPSGPAAKGLCSATNWPVQRAQPLHSPGS